MTLLEKRAQHSFIKKEALVKTKTLYIKSFNIFGWCLSLVILCTRALNASLIWAPIVHIDILITRFDVVILFLLHLFTATLWLALTKIAILIQLKAWVHCHWCKKWFQRIFTVHWFPSCRSNECTWCYRYQKSQYIECPRTFTAIVQLDAHTQSNP